MAGLQVAASAASVPAGGQGVTLTATATNATGTVSWSLSGPGTLSATTGKQVDYVPPLPSQLGTATGVTVTASLDSLQRSIQIGLTRAPGSVWQVIQPPDGNFYGVRYLNGRFYAMENEALLSSPDGVQWTPVALPPATAVQDIVLGPGGQGLVAVGGGLGTVPSTYSTDGVTWSTGTVVAASDGTGFDPTLLQISDVAFGNGVYVGTGIEGVITSTDGVNWLSRTGPVAGGLDVYQIAFGNGRFVAMGDAGSYTTTDGINWTPITLPSGFPVSLGVAFGNGIFVANNGAVTMTSADGLTWSNGGSVAGTTSSSLAGNPYGGNLAFSNGRFYAYGDLGAAMSTDGVQWSQIYTGASGGPLITGVAVNAASETILVGLNGLFEHSSDGTHWASAAAGTDTLLEAVDCMNGTCVAVAANGGVLTSSDSIHWQSIALSQPLFSGITHGNGLFVATGSAVSGGGVIYTSPDGLQWTPASINTAATLFSAAYGAGHFVAVGASDVVFTSSDGVHWSTAGSGIAPVGSYNDLLRVAFGNGRFVVLGNAGGIYSSSDGLQWTTGPTGAPCCGLTYGDRAGFVAVGQQGVVWRSADGITWTTGSTGSQAALDDVTYGDSQYVATTSVGTVWLSEDAVHWTARTLDVQPPLAAGFSGQAFVLVGDAGTIVISTQ